MWFLSFILNFNVIKRAELIDETCTRKLNCLEFYFEGFEAYRVCVCSLLTFKICFMTFIENVVPHS